MPGEMFLTGLPDSVVSDAAIAAVRKAAEQRSAGEIKADSFNSERLSSLDLALSDATEEVFRETGLVRALRQFNNFLYRLGF